MDFLFSSEPKVQPSLGCSWLTSCDDPKLRKVVGRVPRMQLCSEDTETDKLSLTLLGDDLETVMARS